MPLSHSGGGIMALKVAKADVWAVTIDDRPGGAAEKLETLSKAGANLEMLLELRGEHGALASVLPERLVDLARLVALALERFAVLGLGRAVARLEKRDEAL